MEETRRILAVVDPGTVDQPAAERAVWLAKRLDAALDLFVCDYDPYVAGERFGDDASMRAARRQLIEEDLRRLRKFAESLDTGGVALGVHANWHHPLHEGIVDKVREVRPWLAVKYSHYHSAIERTVFSNTDWNLIRDCPSPLLLVKSRPVGDQPCIVAAVDPVHTHDKPAELDCRILKLAADLCLAVGGRLHVFHAFDPAVAIAAAVTTMVTPVSAPVTKLTKEFEARHRKALDALLEKPPACEYELHVHRGAPHRLLVALAVQLKADIVVMGAVSRGRLKRAIIGSTAERVLDHLPCDLLIVKPEAQDRRQGLNQGQSFRRSRARADVS